MAERRAAAPRSWLVSSGSDGAGDVPAVRHVGEPGLALLAEREAAVAARVEDEVIQLALAAAQVAPVLLDQVTGIGLVLDINPAGVVVEQRAVGRVNLQGPDLKPLLERLDLFLL